MQSFMILALVSAAFVQTATSISRRANESFYRAPFEPCKGARVLNPVETVDAHVLFTKLLKKMDVKLIIGLTTKYGVPMVAINPLGRLTCLSYTMLYASLTNSGGLLLPKKFPRDRFESQFRRFLLAYQKAMPVFKMRRHGRRHIIPWAFINELFEIVVPNISEVGDGSPPRDGTFLIQAVQHFLRVLSY